MRMAFVAVVETSRPRRKGIMVSCELSNAQEQFHCQLIETFIRETARSEGGAIKRVSFEGGSLFRSVCSLIRRHCALIGVNLSEEGLNFWVSVEAHGFFFQD